MADLTVNESASADVIRSRIFTIRGVQVMLDRDLAELYGVPTKRLNEQVKRNMIRFPPNFMFALNDEEVQEICAGGYDVGNRSRSQIATLNKGRGHNIKYRPYAFTEHGILMLASVLKSEIAALVSIRITNAFVAMRKTLASIAPLLARIEATDRRQTADQVKNDANQVRNEERFRLILDAMQDKKFPPQKVFFDGQIYDTFDQMKKFVRMAKTELIVIDPYFDDSVLPLIAQKRLGVSLNHLGKKCFAFSSLDTSNIPDILAKI